MNSFDDNFGPWSKPQPLTGYCPFCKKEKEQSDIFISVPEDMISQTIKAFDITDEENSNNLPLIMCKSCHRRIERKMCDMNEALLRMGFDNSSYE